ncbi:ABC transporter substrate-binding protein [Bacillus safensis]|uniref:ABC transporter substrate-binding protein n=1 Tax=Bacillus TaxID=1386 RepID=UPI0009BEA20C|nr:ABC transporter substrate-binding protein [Bacillus safensis]MBK4211815.1 carbohydrate ABC transporter substrate-binding protein [Bacillus pumilus]ARD56365.1 binding protein msmE [Bacillus safensis]MEC0985290.1 ABC transporter substrate-binding protein [Bacillus safensis]MEC1119186.1 ABC transporter substrate-binding protein [Bacillus safensis]MED0802116.1 ABC transporter substrate-binding protein [Bacillus safensis]
MNKKIMLLTAAMFLTMILSACGNNSSSEANGKVTLTLFSTMSNSGERKAFEEVIREFEKKHEQIRIDANFPGNSYEDMIRVKMGANDMPDLFDTHGWAKLRYSEYVADLKEMDWVKQLDPSLDQILKDQDGKVYAYPLNQAKDGLSFNANLLKEYGIEVPRTLDELKSALLTVKEKSKGDVVPLWIPGGDNSNIAQVFDELATPLLITDQKHQYGKELENGSFDWSLYTPLAQFMKDLKDQDLLNKDVLTAKLSQAPELMAQNKIAFTFVGGSLGPEATELNSSIKVGTMPVPAIHEGDEQSWIGGERFTVAAWKDSKHLKEAKQFIDFLAKPENAKKIAEGTSSETALKQVKAKNYYSAFYDQYEQVKIEPYFDRKYLPSGMWAVMATTGQELLAGSITPEQLSKKMEEEYKRLKKQ